MSQPNPTLDLARQRARAMFAIEAGDEAPEWRPVVDGDDADDVNAVAPVCTDPDHDPEDAGALYPCCSDLVIGTGSAVLAVYLAELLTADNDHRGE